VAKNIAFPLEMRKVDKSVREERVRQVAMLRQIEHLLERRPRRLSGDQRQRVAFTLARDGTQPGPTQRAVTARVEVPDPTGADTLVVLMLGGQEFPARLEPDVPLRPGQAADFLVDLSRLVCFDPQTEALIA
jgi:ABC-type sugar transport system ATPase subunit